MNEHQHIWVRPQRIDSFSEWMIADCRECGYEGLVTLGKDRKLHAWVPADVIHDIPQL